MYTNELIVKISKKFHISGNKKVYSEQVRVRRAVGLDVVGRIVKARPPENVLGERIFQRSVVLHLHVDEGVGAPKSHSSPRRTDPLVEWQVREKDKTSSPTLLH